MKSKDRRRKSTITDSESINEGLIKDSKVHTNLAQEVVVTTEDKIRICLMNHLSKMGKKKDWIAPGGILLTIITTLLTTKFKDFYFSADTWTAIFVVAGVLSSGWLLYSLKSAFTSIGINDVIDELKKRSPMRKDIESTIYVDKIRFIDTENLKDQQSAHILKKPKTTFKIIKGIYGIEGKNEDVTDKLNGLIKDGKLITEATNTLAGDPAPGTPKFLDVEYEYNGEKLTKKFKEGDSVILPSE